MLFSNELNYWVIKKYAKKDLLLRMGRHISSLNDILVCRIRLLSLVWIQHRRSWGSL
ncbi:hypothetical protein [Leptospira borgpetersenii]|uniref:hypothetical protein n=1 Tax=Leptospira borgpetersenii TaxID=174 RepID=UPI000B1093A1|nr:hypothetical protein [Leptospira borgpetersenii]UVA63594.1 hypothetical protein LH336_12840 [Leptospira borgpetersenii]